MTYKELKEMLNTLTPEQLNLEVTVFDTETSQISAAALNVNHQYPILETFESSMDDDTANDLMMELGVEL